jgi:hypothetical protein
MEWWSRAGVAALGVALLLVFAALLSLLVALWPVRVSEIPGAPGTMCDASAPQSAGTTVPPAKIQTPAPTRSVGGSPAPTPSPTPSSDSQRALAAVQAQALDPWSRCVSLFGGPEKPIPFDVRLLLIVAISAALGSYVHVATSFATYLGKDDFDAQWTWWYVLRIPIGIALAIVVYFALRGGLLTSSALSDTSVNPFGVCALAALVGLFSRQAINKLEETFETMFRTAPRPATLAIASVVPATFAHNAAPAVLTVTGSGFTTSTRAAINGATRAVTYTSATQLTVQLVAADSAGPTVLTLRLTDQGAPSVSTAITVT